MYLLNLWAARSCCGSCQPTEAATLIWGNYHIGNIGLEPGGGVRGLYLQGKSGVAGRLGLESMGQILARAGGWKTPIMEVTP